MDRLHRSLPWLEVQIACDSRVRAAEARKKLAHSERLSEPRYLG